MNDKLKPLIKQRDLQAILDQREHAKALKSEYDAASVRLTELEGEAIAAIDAGAPTERGRLACGLQVSPGRVSPHWKEVFAKLAGPAAVERVIAETPPGAEKRTLVILP